MLVLLSLSAFFSGAETTFFSLNRTQLARFKKSTRQGDRRLVALLAHPRQVLATILLGNELVNVTLSILLATVMYEGFVERWGVQTTALASVALGTFLVLIFGEICPKSIAIHYAPLWAPRIAAVYQLFDWILRPFRFLLAKLADAVILFLGGEPQKETPLILEEEFRHLIELGAKTGAVQPQERELIHNVFEFSDTRVASIMTPMASVFTLDVQTSFPELLEAIRKKPFSRIPVYEGSPDHLLGILLTRDLFALRRRALQEGLVSLKPFLKPLLRVEGSRRVNDLFQEFRQTRIHMAVVLQNEKPAGVVTMGDVLSELFGELEKKR